MSLPSTNSNTLIGTVAKDIEVEEYNDFEKCAAIREEWDSFVENLEGEIFLTYDWCRIWWKHYGKGRELLILVFRWQGDIIGLLPVFHETIWLGPLRSNVIKIVGTDFTPIAVSIPIRQEFIERVLSVFRSFIDREWKWDIIHLGSIAGIYKSTTDLVSYAQKAFLDSYHVGIKEEDVQTYYEIPLNWEVYLKTLPSKYRANAKKAFRKVEEQKTNIVLCTADAENLIEVFDAFVEMHQAYWRALGKPGHFGAWPGSYQYHREQAEIQAERDRLRLHQIVFDGKCVSYEYNYRYGKTNSWFLYGRSGDAYKAGFGFNWIALRPMLEFAAREGVTWADSMRGFYSYKIETGGKLLPIRSVTIVPSKGLRAIRVKCFRLLARAIDIAYVKIWRRRLASRLHYRVGPFWKTWIKSHVLSA